MTADVIDAIDAAPRPLGDVIEAGSGPRRDRVRSGRRRVVSLVVCIWIGLALVAPATWSAEESDPVFDDIFDEAFDPGPNQYPDPIETVNRGTFAFNRQVDRWILDPITRAYRFVVPKPVRLSFARVFLNLGSTSTLANDLLQLEWKDAGVTGARLVLNTTFGIAGLFDVAAKVGLEGHSSDFGQTLALAGVPSGPYLVLPLLGPANVRDGSGLVIDAFFQPTYYVIGPADLLIGPSEILIYTGSEGISTRDQHFLALKALEDSSVDFYATLRSGYFQQRVDEIWGRRSGHRTTEEPGLYERDDQEHGGADDPLAFDELERVEDALAAQQNAP